MYLFIVVVKIQSLLIVGDPSVKQEPGVVCHSSCSELDGVGRGPESCWVRPARAACKTLSQRQTEGRTGKGEVGKARNTFSKKTKLKLLPKP